MKPGFETASSSNAAHETMGFLAFLSAPPRALTVCPCGPALSFSVCRILVCSVMVLSPFLPCFSRGNRGQVARLLPSAALTGEPKEISSVSVDFFGGTVTRRVPACQEGRACVGRAQVFLPSCRARENKGR